MTGSITPSNVPNATSNAVRVSISTVSGAAISSFQSFRVKHQMPTWRVGSEAARFAERDDLPFFSLTLGAANGVRCCHGELRLETVEAAAEEIAMAQGMNKSSMASLPAADIHECLHTQQHAAFQPRLDKSGRSGWRRFRKMQHGGRIGERRLPSWACWSVEWSDSNIRIPSRRALLRMLESKRTTSKYRLSGGVLGFDIRLSRARGWVGGERQIHSTSRGMVAKGRGDPRHMHHLALRRWH